MKTLNCKIIIIKEAPVDQPNNIEYNFRNFSLVVDGKKYTLENLYPVKADHAKAITNNAIEIALQLKLDDYDFKKAFTAALLHDVMKAQARANYPNKEKDLLPLREEHWDFCRKMEIFVDEGIEGHTTNYWITHAILSAYYAWKELGIRNKDILRAIAHHQTGRYYEDYENMSDLEKIIMLADYIDEQDAEYEAMAMSTLRKTKNLDLALLVVLTGTVQKELFRQDKPGGPTPNGNIIKIWEKLADAFIKESLINERLSLDIKGYIENEYMNNKLLSKLYFEGKLKDNGIFAQALNELLNDKEFGKSAQLFLKNIN